MSSVVANDDVERIGDMIWFAFGSGAGTLVSISQEAIKGLRGAYKSQIEEVVARRRWRSIEKRMLDYARAAGKVAAASAIKRGSDIIEGQDIREVFKLSLGVYVCPLECDERLLSRFAAPAQRARRVRT